MYGRLGAKSVQLSPDTFCLGLYALNRVDQNYRAVYDATCTLYLHAKVRMAGGVNKIE
jgi:hypothetical protein